LGLVRAQRQRLLVGLTGRGLGETSATGIAGPGPEPHCGALTLVVWSQAAGREDPPAAGRRRSESTSDTEIVSLSGPMPPPVRLAGSRGPGLGPALPAGVGVLVARDSPLFFLESISQDPCPAPNGTRRATKCHSMSRVLTRRTRREPIARLANRGCRGHLSVPTVQTLKMALVAITQEAEAHSLTARSHKSSFTALMLSQG
jgi:hypothetical protein